MVSISEDQMRHWLRVADDDERIEFPLAHNYEIEMAGVEAIKPELEQIVGRELRIDRYVQDATFLTQLDYIAPSDDPPIWHTIFAVSFSNFGRLCTIWTVCPSHLKFSQAVTNNVITRLSLAGFRYVDVSLLEENYSGNNSYFAGASWYSRFFDYV